MSENYADLMFKRFKGITTEDPEPTKEPKPAVADPAPSPQPSPAADPAPADPPKETPNDPPKADDKKGDKPGDQPADPPKADGNQNHEPPEKPADKPKVRTRHVIKKQSVDPTEVAEIAAAAAAQAVKSVTKPAEVKSAPTIEIPEIYAAKADIFERMEKLFPEKYGKGKLVKRLVESAKAVDDYKKSWEADNKGQKFNPDEHRDAIAELAPDLDPDDVDEARVDLKIEKRMAPLNKQQEEDRAAKRSKDTEAALTPIAETARNSLVESLVDTVDPEFASILKSGDTEKVKQYLAENDDKAAIIFDVRDKWQSPIELVAKLMSDGAQHIFDKNNRSHVAILKDVIPRMEAELENTQDEDGRTFTTVEKFMQMTPSQQARFRTIDRDIAVGILKREANLEASARLKARNSIRDRAIKDYLAKNGTQKTETPTSPRAPEERPTVPATKAVGTQSPFGGATVGVKPATPEKTASYRDSMFSKFTQ